MRLIPYAGYDPSEEKLVSIYYVKSDFEYLYEKFFYSNHIKDLSKTYNLSIKKERKRIRYNRRLYNWFISK